MQRKKGHVLLCINKIGYVLLVQAFLSNYKMQVYVNLSLVNKTIFFAV